MKYLFLMLLSFLSTQGFIFAVSKDSLPEVHLDEWKAMNESKAETIKWFMDSKFGMFIHWGLYSIPAGIWDGQKIHEMRTPHVAEWIQHAARIPRMCLDPCV